MKVSKKIRWSAYILAGICIAILGFCFVNHQIQNKSFPSLSIDHEIIGQDEYVETMSEVSYDVQADIQNQYGLTWDDQFWTKELDDKKTYQILTERTVETLAYRHALYDLGKEQGYVASGTYQDILDRMKQENEKRKQKKERGEAVYGLMEYTPEIFMTYEMQMIREMYCEDGSNPGMQVTDEEIDTHYQSQTWETEGIGTNAPLEKVKDIVILQVRRQKFERFVQERAQNIKVKTDWERLYEFTLKNIDI